MIIRDEECMFVFYGKSEEKLDEDWGALVHRFQKRKIDIAQVLRVSILSIFHSLWPHSWNCT